MKTEEKTNTDRKHILSSCFVFAWRLTYYSKTGCADNGQEASNIALVTSYFTPTTALIVNNSNRTNSSARKRIINSHILFFVPSSAPRLV